MKTPCGLEMKLKKLPDSIIMNDIDFSLLITKDRMSWVIEYADLYHNVLLSVKHSSIQAAVDKTLAVLKRKFNF